MNYFTVAFSGLSWTAGLRLTLRVVTILRMGLLARILSKSALGVFGIVVMVLSFLEIITETGINVFLLQKKEDIKNYIDTAWMLSILRGLVISLGIIIVAPVISNFFNSPEVKNLLYLLSLASLIRGFINPAIVTFVKNLQFGREFLLRSSIFLVEVLVSIVICWYTRSPVGLVWGLIASAAFEVAVSWLFIPVRPQLVWNTNRAKEILHWGKWVTGFGVLDYLFTQSDNIIVGKLLGESSLGVYQNTYKISTTPVSEIVDVFYRATFPIFVRMTQQKHNLKNAVIKTLLVVNGLTISLGLLIYLFASQIINIVFGANWQEAIPVLQILAFLGIARGISYSFNAVFMAQKLQKYVTIIIFTSTLGLLITIVPFVQWWGIVGAGVSATLGAAISLPVAFYLMHKTFRSL